MEEHAAAVTSDSDTTIKQVNPAQAMMISYQAATGQSSPSTFSLIIIIGGKRGVALVYRYLHGLHLWQYYL